MTGIFQPQFQSTERKDLMMQISPNAHLCSDSPRPGLPRTPAGVGKVGRGPFSKRQPVGREGLPKYA